MHCQTLTGRSALLAKFIQSRYSQLMLLLLCGSLNLVVIGVKLWAIFGAIAQKECKIGKNDSNSAVEMHEISHHILSQRLQESLANAKVNARQHCVSLSCLCNSLTQIEWVVQLLLPPKHAKSREIPREFDRTAVQGHPRSSILVSIESPYVTS